MKRITIILFTTVYFISISGVAVSYFFCCGKFKEAYIFHCKSLPENCKGNKLPGCCETKTIVVKVKDTHAGSHQVKINPIKFSFSIFGYPVISVENHSYSHSEFFTLTHAPPLQSKHPRYLAVNNFRI